MDPGTTLLCYDDPYRTRGSGWLDSVQRDPKGLLFVTFSETIFYPQGGGQKGDRGEIQLAVAAESGCVSRRVRITDTRKHDGVIRHYVSEDPALESELLQWVGQAKVDYSLDWSFRFVQMRSHSAGHLIHCCLQDLIGRPLPIPRSSPLDETGGGYNLYETVGLLTQAELVAATERLNEFVQEDHSIATQPCEDRGPGFRYWVCENWQIPCGGLHPKSTREIGTILTSTHEKKGTTKVQFQLLDLRPSA